MRLQNEMGELIQNLDKKFTRWDIYRTADRAWYFTGEEGGEACEIREWSIVDAFELALSFAPLPVVPRPPKTLQRDVFKPTRSGNKWRLLYLGSDCCVSCDTKKAVETAADIMSGHSITEYRNWHVRHGWTLGKKEGVDFRYSH